MFIKKLGNKNFHFFVILIKSINKLKTIKKISINSKEKFIRKCHF